MFVKVGGVFGKVIKLWVFNSIFKYILGVGDFNLILGLIVLYSFKGFLEDYLEFIWIYFYDW